ncbi:hypothetical protein MTO96_010966 [Rhipicephalus appendiculatus]
MSAAQSARVVRAAAACRLPPMPLAKRLVRACGSVRDKHVIEVGPGPGCLTRPLLELGARRVVAIEKDSRFAPTLEILSEASEGRLHVVMGDIFHQHLQELIPEELGKSWDSDDLPEVCLVGNLPFSVASPLLRCRLSVLCQNYCTTQHRLTLNGSSFVPPAEVDVGLVRLVPLKEPVIRHPFDLIEKVINCLFNGRQKVLTNGAKNLFPRDRREELVPRPHKEPEIREYHFRLGR